MRATATAGSLLLAVGLVLPTGASAQHLPIDSTLAVQVLREATDAFAESSDSLRGNDRFRSYLAELTAEWGVDWDEESVLRPEPPEQVIGALVARGEIGRALAYTNPTAPRWRQGRSIRIVLDTLAARGRIDEALGIADSLEVARLGLYAVLRSAATDSVDWRPTFDRVEAFIRDDLADHEDAAGYWGVFNYELAEHDFGEAWAHAGEWEPDSVLAWRIDVLDLAYDQHLPEADSLFLDTYTRSRSIEETAVRDDLLALLDELCDWKEIAACEGLEFPEQIPDRRRLLRYDIERAYRDGRLAEADEIGNELRQLLPEEDYAFILARSLGIAVWPCVHLARCGRAYDSLLTATLPELDRIAKQGSGPTADSLNAHMAALWAGRDLGRARAALERIESPEARSRGLAGFAQSAYTWNREAAIQAWREHGPAQSTPLQQDYLRFMQWGDTLRAEETIALIARGFSRTRARLEWADRVRDSGRWREARRLAVAALDEWDPSADPLDGSRGLLSLFHSMGAESDLIAWARSRPNADDRAAALAAVIGLLPRPSEVRRRSR